MIFTGKRTCVLFTNSHKHVLASAPQIRSYQQEPVNGAEQVIAWSPSIVIVVSTFTNDWSWSQRQALSKLLVLEKTLELGRAM